MPFPLPKDPSFIKEVVRDWIIDVDDRVTLMDMDGAEHSLRTAERLYLSLPPGNGDCEIERSIVTAKEKMGKFRASIHKPTCEH